MRLPQLWCDDAAPGRRPLQPGQVPQVRAADDQAAIRVGDRRVQVAIYEYRCKSCGQITEAFLRTRREANDVRCEHCGDGDLERVYLSPAAGVRVSESREVLPCCGEQGGCSSPKRCCENW